MPSVHSLVRLAKNNIPHQNHTLHSIARAFFHFLNLDAIKYPLVFLMRQYHVYYDLESKPLDVEVMQKHS